jgi:hypothetical protein
MPQMRDIKIHKTIKGYDEDSFSSQGYYQIPKHQSLPQLNQVSNFNTSKPEQGNNKKLHEPQFRDR